jgi:hypothetical protein
MDEESSNKKTMASKNPTRDERRDRKARKAAMNYAILPLLLGEREVQEDMNALKQV